MKVLFVGRQKNNGGLSVIVEKQIKSIIKHDPTVSIHRELIKNGGPFGYINAYFSLKKRIKNKRFDLIHANYSLSGFISLLCFPNNRVIISLMGSDVYNKNWLIRKILLYIIRSEAHIIVKSSEMASEVPTEKKLYIIPNGVNMNIFKPKDKLKCKEQLNWNPNKINILFSGKQNRQVKNFALAQESIQHISSEYDIDLHILDGVKHEVVPLYLNAADILVISSHSEGSSNITKEAMACNTVIVSTKVGDTPRLFESTAGYFLANKDVPSFTKSLIEAIKFKNSSLKVKGRQRLVDLRLDDVSISCQISKLYNHVMNQ